MHIAFLVGRVDTRVQEKHQASQSSTEDQSSGFEQPRTRRRRLHLSSRSRLIAALVVFAAATIVALIQPPWHNSLQPPEKLSTDWAIYPIERNAFARLPVITGSLEEVFVSPNGERIWAVGAGGLVLHSLDGGRTWTQQQSIAVTGPSPELSLEQT